MKFKFLIALLLLLSVAGLPAHAQDAGKPLTKNQVMDLVSAGMNSTELAKKVERLGIDFDLTDDYLQGLRKAGAQDVLIQALRAARPQPLSKQQVLQLVAAGVPSQRASTLVTQHGIDFAADEEYLNTLRVAGADDSLLAAVREASAAVKADLVVTTSPNAGVYLDGELQGLANAQGELTIRAKLGAHALKVSLVGKKDFQQSVTLAGVQGAKIEARLLDAPGILRLRSLAGASISLDGENRGNTEASGELVVGDVPPGAHQLRVSAPGKREYLQSVTVVPGQETLVEVTLQPTPPSPGQVGENPRVGSPNPVVPPATLTFRVYNQKGALSFHKGLLTFGNGTLRYESDDRKDSIALSVADIAEVFETLGDMKTRHDVHVRLKDKKVYVFLSEEGAGHGPAGVQFSQQLISLINQATGRNGNRH